MEEEEERFSIFKNWLFLQLNNSSIYHRVLYDTCPYHMAIHTFGRVHLVCYAVTQGRI